MERRQLVNVFRSIDPSWIISNKKIIGQAFFGLDQKSVETSLFIDELTGYFTYKAPNKPVLFTDTAQTEIEAAGHFSVILKKLATNAQQFGQREPFANLSAFFNLEHLRLKSVQPFYKESDKVYSWTAFYGIDLPGSAGNSMPLEGASVSLEIVGRVLTQLYYYYLPVIDGSKEAAINNNASAGLYRKINRNVIAPFTASSIGWLPASKSSIEFKTDPLVVFASAPATPSPTACPSMLTLSGVTPPQASGPGKAAIAIKMEYKCVTTGEGAIDNTAIINTTQFNQTFKLGDQPGTVTTTPLRLASLPQVGVGPSLLTGPNLAASTTINPSTGFPSFTNYYNVTVQYDFTLSTKAGYSLWEGLRWVSQCSESRGLFMLIPFFKELRDWVDVRTNKVQFSNGYVKNYLLSNGIAKSDVDKLKKDDLEYFRVQLRAVPYYKYIAKLASYIVLNMLNDNKATLANCNIEISGVKVKGIFSNSDTASYAYFMNIDIQNALKALNSDIIFFDSAGKAIIKNNKPVVQLNDADLYYGFLYDQITAQTLPELPRFDEDAADPAKPVTDSTRYYLDSGGQRIPLVGAAGIIGKAGAANMVILNHRVYGASAVGKPYAIHTNPLTVNFLDATEVLIHESGHNAAASFFHKNAGKYEYHQTGLQSNETKKCYPTDANTFEILSDSNNLANLTILP